MYLLDVNSVERVRLEHSVEVLIAHLDADAALVVTTVNHNYGLVAVGTYMKLMTPHLFCEGYCISVAEAN